MNGQGHQQQRSSTAPGWPQERHARDVHVIERLLTFASEHFRAGVALELDPPPRAAVSERERAQGRGPRGEAAVNGAGPRPARGGLRVPVQGREHRYGSLRIALEEEPGEEELELARTLGAVLGERLDEQQLARADHDERVDRIEAVLTSGSLEVVFQPIIDLRTGGAVGVEALSRFPDGGPASPERWFLEAASVGHGVDLELLAIRKALAAFDELPEELYLSLNVSPSTAATPELARILRDAPLERVVFEITEHAAVEDYVVLNDALSRLRRGGLRVAVDDAGSGFASLRHILRMSPDVIKLDMSLTRGIDSDSVVRALSYSIAAFGTAIEAMVVAEGVETEHELAALRFLGVAYAQGYHLSEPKTLPLPGLGPSPGVPVATPLSRSRPA